MKLSIITVNLNNRDGLQKTIDSVICQTFKDFEWIIIDGGSTDGSKELIEQYSEHFSYWVSEPDKGIYNAMNKGILKAKGEYILFLNSGDYLYTSSTIYDVFSIPRFADVLYGDVVMEDSGWQEKRPKKISMYYLIHGGTISHSGGSFIKKNLFDNFGLYDEGLKIVSDWKFFIITVGLNNASTQYIDSIFSYYNEGASSDKELCLWERTHTLNKLLPAKIIEDYQTFFDIENKNNEYEQVLQSAKKLSSIPYIKLIKALLIKTFFLH